MMPSAPGTSRRPVNRSGTIRLQERDFTSDARKSPLFCFSLSLWRPSIGDLIRVPARRIPTAPLAVNGVGTGLNPTFPTHSEKQIITERGEGIYLDQNHPPVVS